MRFTIEIPDELFRSANSISEPSVSLSTSDGARDAMSGGAGPGGGAADLAQMPHELSGGSAEHYVAPVGPGAVTEAIDGGPAPTSTVKRNPGAVK